LGALTESLPLREAALLLRPNDAGQRWRLVDEYQRVSMRPETPDLLTRGERARDAAARDEQWQAGLEHLEYLVRNHLIRRHEAIVATGRYRWRYVSVVPDAPVALRRFLTEVYPLVLALQPGRPDDYADQPGSLLTADQIDQVEENLWTQGFFGVAATHIPNGIGEPFTSNSDAPEVLGDDAADLLADMIVRWFPADIYVPVCVGHVFERVPGCACFAWMRCAGPPPDRRQPS